KTARGRFRMGESDLISQTHGRVTFHHTHWQIQAEPHVQIRMKRVFGRINKHQHGILMLSNTTENCRELAWFCERYSLEISESDLSVLQRQAREHRDQILKLERIIDPNYVPRSFSLVFPPRSYQSREAEIYLTNKFLLIADDVGLGKTASAICSFTDPRT